MGLGHSPSIVTNGLVMCLDGANYKSFKGVPATNILNQIGYNASNTNTALFKYTQGSENVYIPSLGYVNSKFVDFYNDYNGGSGACCPALFTFGAGAAIAVSPSTTYTYSIIYKTTTGYSHPNYMYRYEYNSSNTYLTEAGVHSTTNRTSLGDGWWFAWGQFTTQATTAYLNTYLFHYEYATYNRVYVYKASLYAGNYIIPPEHMLNSAEVRGATVATGGGWADLIGNSNNGTLTNGPTYSSSNGGSIVFDGTDDYISGTINGSIFTGNFTQSAWVYKLNANQIWQGVFTNSSPATANTYLMTFGNGSVSAPYNSVGANQVGISESGIFLDIGTHTNRWLYIVMTKTGSTLNIYCYKDGSLLQTSGTITWNNGNFATTNNYQIGRHWAGGGIVPLQGNVSNVCVYNRALTELEIQQNFNATRGRFGV